MNVKKLMMAGIKNLQKLYNKEYKYSLVVIMFFAGNSEFKYLCLRDISSIMLGSTGFAESEREINGMITSIIQRTCMQSRVGGRMKMTPSSCAK